MKVIIVGAHGEARQLINRISTGWNISVIDMDQEKLRNFNPNRQIEKYQGDGTSTLVLKKAGDDYERRYTFNTVIASNMELVNTLSKYEDSSNNGNAIRQEVLEAILLMLSPIVPHICKELWQHLGHKKDIVTEIWPVVDESALEQNSVKMMLQVNGKLRGEIVVSVSTSQDEIEKMALTDENVMRFTEGKPVKKIIIVPKRLVNIVV